MPLFDRLIDDEPGTHFEARPARTLDRAGLLESVRRELEHLCNCRAPLPLHQLESRERSVIDYGIPDFRNVSPHDAGDRAKAARAMAAAISAFEPRLSQVRVELIPAPSPEATLQARVEALLRFESVAEPVSFMTVVAQDRAEVEVRAAAG